MTLNDKNFVNLLCSYVNTFILGGYSPPKFATEHSSTGSIPILIEL